MMIPSMLLSVMMATNATVATSGDGAREGEGRARLEVHTSTRNVRDCAWSPSGSTVMAATGGGLVMLTAKGATVDHLTRLNGLPGTQVDVVVPIDERRWWVGTEGGLAKVRVDEGTAGVVERIDGPSIRAVAAAGDDVLVGTWGEGVMRVEGGQLEAVPFLDGERSAARRRITQIERFDGQWVAATAGAGLWRGDRSGLSAWSTKLDRQVVWSMEVVDNRLWAGTLMGLFRGGPTWQRLDDVDARRVTLHDGEVHVGTMGQGLRRYAVEGRRLRGVEDEAEDVAALAMVHDVDWHGARRCIATTEGMWLDAGVGSPRSKVLDTELPSRDISAMAYDDAADRLWVGTFDQGLAFHDADRWHRVRSAEVDPQINALALQRVDGRTVVWVGTARGVVRVDGDDVQTWTKKAGLPNDHVQSIAVLRGGDVAVGTIQGLVRLREGEIEPFVAGAEPGRWAVWAIAEDHDGTVWLGTTEGLIAWPRQQAWRRYSMFDGTLPDNWVTAVVPQGDEIWVGTYAGGVARLRKGEGAELSGEHLGGGRINPGGLMIAGRKVYASTMGGLLSRPRRAGRAGWKAMDDVTLGHDVKGVVVTDAGMWTASRRGVSFRFAVM